MISFKKMRVSIRKMIVALSVHVLRGTHYNYLQLPETHLQATPEGCRVTASTYRRSQEEFFLVSVVVTEENESGSLL